MTHLIVGFGQVGRGIHTVLLRDKKSNVDTLDTLDQAPTNLKSEYDFMHVAFPFSETFIEDVHVYMNRFLPKIVIIHSTVPVGTTEKIAPNAVHSPVRGVHPNLADGIVKFTKYFGGSWAEIASEVFCKVGVNVRCTKSSRDTEALKLWDTTQYGVQIVLMKSIHEWCKKNNVDFNLIYTEANCDYDYGYKSLGREEVARPYLKFTPGPIGGHCVIPNCYLLDSDISEWILKNNEEYKK